MENKTTVEKRIAHDKELLLEQLRKTPIVEIACSKAEVGRSSYYRWRKEDAEFAKQADEAMSDGSLLMNDVAESYLISAIKDKNMTAITLWLRTHHPAYASKLEVNGRMTQIREDLTPAQQEVVEEALRLASLVAAESIKQLTSTHHETPDTDAKNA